MTNKTKKRPSFIDNYTKLERNVKAGECEMIMVLFLEWMQQKKA